MSSSSSEEEEAEQVGHEALALSENNAVDVISADSPGRPLVFHGGVFNNVIAGNQNVIVNISRDENNSDSDFAKHANEFLRRVKIHLNKTVGDCSNLTSEPIKMQLDTEGSKKSGLRNIFHGNTETLFGNDIKPIELDELHDDCNDKPSRHVMILGEAGAGKTTLTRIYSARVAEKKVESLDNIALVHIVSAMFLHGKSLSTVFDLLFSQQMSGDADTDLSLKVAEAGERWVNENAEKILIVIDGLDQLAKIIGGRKHPNINASTPSRSDHIIANVMSGNIWRGARVLTTSRWDAYWSLMATQKPDKVIGLRGFDDENMKKAIFRRINDEGISATLLHDLHGTAKLLALCRTPIFLKYTSEIFLDNAKKLPDSFSGLMSAIFFKFLHSAHASEPEIDGLTRLAYDLTQQKRFHFTKRYMEKFGVKPEKLKGFLSCGTNLPPGIDKPVPDDITYVFTHETLQEFCCALHIVNLEPPAVRKFIGETLQESRMEMIRKFLYGVMLDYNNTRSLRSYLEDRSCSIEMCQDILLMLFPHLIPNKTIVDIKVVHLLSECGADRIYQIREYVQNIHIDAYDLLPNDQITLATIIKQTSPLKNVFIGGVVFDKSLVQHLMDCPRHAERYEVSRLTIFEDKDMPASAYKNVAPVLNAANCTEMVFVRCNLTGDKLRQFGRGCSEISVTLTTLILADSSMPADAFREVSVALDVTQCKMVGFANCELNCRKLSEFGSGCSHHGLSLECITIADKTMAEDGYRELSKVIGASKCMGLQLEDCEINKDKLIAFHDECRKQHIQLTELKVVDKSMPADAFREFSTTLDVTQCKKVVFGNCQLTTHKLSEFGSGCSDHGLSLEFITIANKEMAEDGYRELSKVIGASKCMRLQLEDCEINKDELIAFHDECRKQHIQLTELNVGDKSMPADAFREFSTALYVTQCKKVLFGDCQLTGNKLSEFGSGCSDHGLSLEFISIADKTMAEDGYRELSKVIGASKCMGISLEDCEITKDKLIAFHDECRKQQIQLTELKVWDDSIPADAFKEFSRALDVTQCKKVVFGNCQLTSHKLSEFGSGCSDHGLSLEFITIADKTMAENGYRELSKVIGASKCMGISLSSCELNKDKLIAFHDECRNQHIQLTELEVWDNSMPPDAFREVLTALDVTQCIRVLFGNCELTSHKLSEFRSGCSDHGLSLTELIIFDKSMSADEFREVAITLQVTRCKKVDISCCELTSRKLSDFSRGCAENGLSLEWIVIRDEKMAKDVYKELSKLTGITECPWFRLQLCDLSKDKLLTFNNECQKQNIQLDKLDILNEAMAADVYHAVCNTFYVTKCQEISFIKCDITPSKLQSFLTECQKHRLTIAKLQIIEFKPDSDPTNEMVSVLCDLMTDVVDVLVICGWELNAGQLELLENTRRLTSSKAKVVTVMNKTSTSKDKNPYSTVWKNGEVIDVPREWIIAFYRFYKDEDVYNENLMSSFDSFLMSA